MKRLVTVVLAVAVLGLVPAALAAGTLSGTYKETIKNDPAQAGHLNGTWELTFTPGHVKVVMNGTTFGHIKDKIKGDRITIYHGAMCPSTGRYKFKLSGKKLTFTKISDPCAGRRDVLTHGPFHKVS